MPGRLSNADGSFAIGRRHVPGVGASIRAAVMVALVRNGAGTLRTLEANMRVASPPSGSALARNVAAARRMCAAFVIGKKLFGSDLVTAPPAEILLQLYTAELEGRSVTGTALASVLQISEATLVRWLHVLKQRGLIDLDEEGPVDVAASYRIAKSCEMALDALIVGADF